MSAKLINDAQIQDLARQLYQRFRTAEIHPSWIAIVEITGDRGFWFGSYRYMKLPKMPREWIEPVEQLLHQQARAEQIPGTATMLDEPETLWGWIKSRLTFTKNSPK